MLFLLRTMNNFSLKLIYILYNFVPQRQNSFAIYIWIYTLGNEIKCFYLSEHTSSFNVSCEGQQNLTTVSLFLDSQFKRTPRVQLLYLSDTSLISHPQSFQLSWVKTSTNSTW